MLFPQYMLQSSTLGDRKWPFFPNTSYSICLSIIYSFHCKFVSWLLSLIHYSCFDTFAISAAQSSPSQCGFLLIHKCKDVKKTQNLSLKIRNLSLWSLMVFLCIRFLSSPYYSKPQQEKTKPCRPGLGLGIFKFEYHCESGPFF